MSFRNHVDAVLGEGVCKGGLGGLKAKDAARLTPSYPRDLQGSADVDKAMEAADPAGARWDYVIGLRRGTVDHAYWVEVHPASGDKDATKIQEKFDWLRRFWKASPGLAAYPREVVWVASGSSSFTARSPKIKALAAKGCRFVGGHFQL